MTVTVKFLSSFHTNQPYVEYVDYLIGETKVRIRHGQGYSRIVSGPDTEETVQALRAAYPKSEVFAQLKPGR